jgi:hypothetical protein
VENVQLTETYIAVLVSSVLIHKYSLTYIKPEEEEMIFRNVVIHFMEGKHDIFDDCKNCINKLKKTMEDYTQDGKRL